MIGLLSQKWAQKKLKVIAFGAHCDDIEIGCGGTLLKWMSEEKIQQIIWVVFSSTEKRKLEALQSADLYLANIPECEIFIHDYRDAYLSFSAQEIKYQFEEIKQWMDPDVVFTHYRNDRHQDHRLLSDLAWNTFRNHLILEYEIPKYDGDLHTPNGYVSLPTEQVDRKIELLLGCYHSQVSKHWFDAETFKSLMRIRGLECGSPSRYAEAFHLRKCLL
ncbi:MAG: PIG-L family deacetylase [Saprospiraceae bacterium]|nr:PIG-L family deacetylase [Saprospiraceae bacterium]